MKNFKQFVDEAVETSASAQAKKMGLTGNAMGIGIIVKVN